MSNDTKITFLFSSKSFILPKNKNLNSDEGFVSLRDNPSMPAMWDSIDEGETWDWGDYVLVLQKRPRILAHYICDLANAKKTELNDSEAINKDIESHNNKLRYLYCLSAFYKENESSLCMVSSRPAFVLTIEQVNYSSFINEPDMKDVLDECDIDGWATPVFCAFVPKGRFNFGNVQVGFDKEKAKHVFFEKLKEHITGQPKFIGSIHFFQSLEKEKQTRRLHEEFERCKSSPDFKAVFEKYQAIHKIYDQMKERERIIKTNEYKCDSIDYFFIIGIIILIIAILSYVIFH